MPEYTQGDGRLSESPAPTPPQTKISHILGKIQKLHLLQATSLEPNFVWNDFLVPYSKEQLPRDENGRLDYTTDFMEEQKRVLSEASPKSVLGIVTRHSDEELPPHIQLTAISDVSQVGNLLGCGRFGEVHEVKFHNDSQAVDERSNVFAMKRLRKPAPRQGSGVSKCTVSEFKTELDHLSRCRHHHIIDLRASFTDESHFGFIVSPVATSTLQALLSKYVSEICEHKAVRQALFHAFGCLLDAVYYLHDTLQIRHRDIKPRNILMHDQRVIICDLGSAYDFEPLDRKESTDDRRPPGTHKYKAPEVLESVNTNERPRHNNKVDIFSLGCVFLEMHTVLCEQTLDRMAKSITHNKTAEFEGNWTYASTLEHVHRWLEEIYESHNLGEGRTDLIRSMVELQPYSRRHVMLTQNSSFAGNTASENLRRSCPRKSVTNTLNILQTVVQVLLCLADHLRL